MGKRKSAKKIQGPKKKEKLPTTFQCLFCNHENSVSVSIEKKSGVGNLQCKVCGQTFQTSTNYLSAPVDVYADWVDAAEAVKQKPAAKTSTSRPVDRADRSQVDEENAGFIVDDDDAAGDEDDDY
ncbi:Elf1-domain-containing protein [Bimuria novae-zelandiae CBS 107.79]|uniref:Transcription elongation factor 1 homolog n=1 Tax=Bimuria novae-zelandiae CBS 107.79 TaxID=1447943 RepID=A0A6A5V3B8_9PLEO|nr:Elf1-domain-containing protein [Bimuria novae-zelandiae CBS 107.79]